MLPTLFMVAGVPLERLPLELLPPSEPPAAPTAPTGPAWSTIPRKTRRAVTTELQRNYGKRQLGPGTLYRTVHRLLRLGLIAESGERPDPAIDDERRRYYRITAAGREAARDEARRLEEIVQTARAGHLLDVAGAP